MTEYRQLSFMDQLLSCLNVDSSESEGHAGASSTFRTIWKERGGAPGLLEYALQRDNLNEAYKRVRSNKGAPGIDGMTVDDALPWLQDHRDEFIERIMKGKYTPSPVKRCEIPKPDGGVRLLGIPTVLDRIVQQALTQVLTPIYEPKFADGSYGYRPYRKGTDAIQKIKEYAEQGYTWAVVLDLSKYFDTLNHTKLLNLLRRDIHDERIIQIIKRFLKSGVMADGVVQPTEAGSPQGGVISPLLANVYLNEFDQEFTKRGVPWVRYADDIVILAKSPRAAQRLLLSSTKYLTETLHLKVNEEKSRVTSVFRSTFKYLGFTLGKNKSGVHIWVAGKAKQKLMRDLKELTKRNCGTSIGTVLGRITRKLRGWLNYYSIAEMKSFIAHVGEWLRHRIRMILWKQWKKPKGRMRNLLRLGADRDKAFQAANSRRGIFWSTCHSTANWAISKNFLLELGLFPIEEAYSKLHSSYCKRPVRKTVCGVL